jgi:hypothetical protein
MLDDAPQLLPQAVWYMEAYQTLRSCKPVGDTLYLIDLRDVLDYCEMYYIEGDYRVDLFEKVKALDLVYADWWSKQRQKAVKEKR